MHVSLYNYFSDINKCAIDADICDTDAACTNTPGGFTCTCNQGYTGDGVTCMGKCSLQVLNLIPQQALTSCGEGLLTQLSMIVSSQMLPSPPVIAHPPPPPPHAVSPPADALIDSHPLPLSCSLSPCCCYCCMLTH